MKSLPLILYLDSSDFSDLSNPTKRTVEITEVERKLLDWQDRGLIELRFSHIHIIEAAATKREFTDSASNRFAVMKRLCGFNCIISPLKILEYEALRLSKESGNDPQINVYQNEGDWFPSMDDSDEKSVSPAERLKEAIKKEIELTPDRKSRRKIERASFNADGSIKASVLKQMSDTNPDIIDELSEKFPIPRELLAESVKAHNISGRTDRFLDAIKKSLSDLDNLAVWYERDWDRISPVSLYLREVGEDVREGLTVAVNKYLEITEENKSAGLDIKLSKKLLCSVLDDLILSMPNNLAKSLTKGFELELVRSPNFELTPSIFTMGTVAACIGKLTVLSNRKAKVSDFGDIYHSANLPYVDIFRCDGFVASALTEANLPFATTVVGKFIELPNAIKQLLEERM